MNTQQDVGTLDILDEAMQETPWSQLSRRERKKRIRAAYERACKEELCKPKEELDKTTIPLPQHPAIYGLHQYKMKNSKGPAFYKNKETLRQRAADNIHPMDPMRSIAEALDLRKEGLEEFIEEYQASKEASSEPTGEEYSYISPTGGESKETSG